MREKRVQQRSLFHILPRNQIGRELEAISAIIDANRKILELVYQDLAGLKTTEPLSMQDVTHGNASQVLARG